MTASEAPRCTRHHSHLTLQPHSGVARYHHPTLGCGTPPGVASPQAGPLLNVAPIPAPPLAARPPIHVLKISTSSRRPQARRRGSHPRIPAPPAPPLDARPPIHVLKISTSSRRPQARRRGSHPRIPGPLLRPSTRYQKSHLEPHPLDRRLLLLVGLAG